MKVVILGANGRDTREDREFVFRLIERCAQRYPFCVFVTAMTQVGVGSFVKEKCLEKDAQDKYKYQLVDILTRIYGASILSRQEQKEVFEARNAALFALGDVLYYLDTGRTASFLGEELRKSFEAAGRPVKVFLPGEELELL